MAVAYQFICPFCGHKEPDHFVELDEIAKCVKCKNEYKLTLEWRKEGK